MQYLYTWQGIFRGICLPRQALLCVGITSVSHSLLLLTPANITAPPSFNTPSLCVNTTLHGNTLILPSLVRGGVLKYVSNARVILGGRRERALHAGGFLSSPLPLANPSLPLLISQGLSPCHSWDFWEILEKRGRCLPVSSQSLSTSLYHCLALSSWLSWQLLLLFIELISGNYRLLQVIEAHLDESDVTHRKVVGSISSGQLLFKGPVHCF